MNPYLIPDYKALQKIFKTARFRKRKCFLCDKQAINSHILQKNGVLSGISYLNHIKQMETNDFFNASAKGAVEIKDVGLNSALSLNLFCNEHDTEMFKLIEGSTIDFNDYIIQLLFSFRAFCAAVRVKEINTEVFSNILNTTLNIKSETFMNTMSFQKEAHEVILNQIDFYKIEMLHEMVDTQFIFHFETLDLKYLPVCSSSVVSSFNPDIKSEDVDTYKSSWINCLFINLVPFQEKLKLILGYHYKQVDATIVDYITSWKNCKVENQSVMLTELIA